MQKFIGQFIDSTGAAVSGASVAVTDFLTGATSALFADDNQTGISNPQITDSNGGYSFSARDGRYNLAISKAGTTTVNLTKVLLDDNNSEWTNGDSGNHVLGNLVYISGAGTVRLATNAGTSAQGQVVGICVSNTVASGAIGQYTVKPGEIVRGLSGGVAGNFAYLSTAGTILTSPPGSGFDIIIGTWISSSVLYFSPPSSPDSRFIQILNVLDFGADPSGNTDCSTAINAAYASRANSAGGAALYFPAGSYKVNANLVFSGTANLTLYGDGPTSQISVTIATGDVMTVTNVPFLSIHDIQFVGNVVRNAGTWILTASGQADISINNTSVNLNLGGCWNIVNTSVLRMNSNICITSGTVAGNISGDCVLRITHCSEAIICGNHFKSGNNSIAFNRAPCVWIGGGTNTSMAFTGNNFSGGGPRSAWAVSGITSSSGSFTVTTSAAHDFLAGDFLVLRGFTPSGYNNVFRITSVTSTTITVTSTLNPGTTTVQGTAESYATCFYIANDTASSNESRLTGNLFEAQSYISYGSASVYFDGRRDNHLLEGWHLTGNYYDFGATGVLISAKSNGSGIPTVYGISYSGGIHENSTRNMHIEGAAGVTVTGLQSDGFGQIQNGQGGSATGDALSFSGTGSVAIHIFAGAGGTTTQGVTITDCNLGMGRNWNLAGMASTGFNSGLVVDGAGVQDLLVCGNQLYGYDVGGAIKFDNSAMSSSNRWKFQNNNINGAGTTSAPVMIPSVASGSTITLPPGYDTVKITGTTSIATISGGYIGAHVQLIVVNGFSFTTGGNIAIGADSLAAGLLVNIVYDGTNWYVH